MDTVFLPTAPCMVRPVRTRHSWRKASETGVPLHKLPLAEMQVIEPRITDAVFNVLSVENSVASRTSFGGTAPANVRAQAEGWRKRLEKDAISG